MKEERKTEGLKSESLVWRIDIQQGSREEEERERERKRERERERERELNFKSPFIETIKNLRTHQGYHSKSHEC